VVATEVLLVDGGSGECEVSGLVEEVDVILASSLVVFLGVVGDPRRVVGDVRGHNGLGAIHQEERREAC
jgi:hypothetical protein